MKFQLIDQELSEAKIFYATNQFATLTGREVADLLYLNTVLVFMLLNTVGMKKWAHNYVNKTRQYGTYALFRTHATDLYLLAYQVSHPLNTQITMKDPLNSKGLLEKLNFDSQKHIQIMHKLYADALDYGEAYSYFMRLESQLRVTDPFYLILRRQLPGWDAYDEEKKRNIYRQLYNYATRLGGGTVRNTEIFLMLRRILTDKAEQQSGKIL